MCSHTNKGLRFRAGSIIGPQQAYLVQQERRMHMLGVCVIYVSAYRMLLYTCPYAAVHVSAYDDRAAAGVSGAAEDTPAATRDMPAEIRLLQQEICLLRYACCNKRYAC